MLLLKNACLQSREDEKILRRLFIRYFYGSVFAIICGCLGQIMGSVIVGNTFGEEKLAVCSLVLPLFYIFATIGNLTGIGGSVLCAKFLGNRKSEDCKKTFSVTCILTFGSCFFASIILYALLPRIVLLLGTPQSLIAETLSYARIQVLGGIFIAGTYVVFNMLRLDAKSLATMLTFMIMAVLTIVLDFALAPMGIVGVSIALIAGYAAAMIFGFLTLFISSDSLRWSWPSFKELIEYSRQIISTGSPGATENGSILLKSYCLNQLIVMTVGATALSSLSVINSINSFSMAITLGCAGALVPMLSVFSAERDTVSMRGMLKLSCHLGMIVILVFTVLIIIFAPFLVRLFGIIKEPGEAILAIRLFAFSLPFVLVAFVVIYTDLANKHTGIANLLTVLHSLVYLLGAALAMILCFGPVGLWLSFTVCEVATILTAFILHLFMSRKKDNLSKFFLLDMEYEKNGESLAFCVRPSAEGILQAKEHLDRFIKEKKVTPKRIIFLTLAIEEALFMLQQHYDETQEHSFVSVRVLLHERTLIFRLRYDGKMFNPIAYYEEKKKDTTDLETMMDMANLIGMKMILETSDIIEYQKTLGINTLIIVNEDVI